MFFDTSPLLCFNYRVGYQELKARGICVRCKKELAKLGYTCCPSCQEKDREYSKRQIAKRRASQRCLRCGRPAIKGRSYCLTCAEKLKIRDRRRKRRGKYVTIWEKAHGRKLPDGWLIHHLNGNHNDDSPKNLLAIPRKSHKTKLLLYALRRRIKQLEAEVKENNKSPSFVIRKEFSVPETA